MWELQHTKKEHQEHYIFVGEDCIVGRKDSTLLIVSDPSVSRRHAVLYVKHPMENLGDPSKKSSLFLRDEGSKYGTFKNGVRVTSETELADNDVVKFGQLDSEFRIRQMPLIVTTSCLDVSSKNKLKKIIHMLGGHVVSEWQPSCSHLVMSLIKVTIKALCCLISLKPIVLPQYFEELQNSLRTSAAVISPNQYIPPIGESLIDKDKVSFDADLQRKDIFKGKTFFFMDEKQFKKLHLGIVLGAGNAVILCDEKFDSELLLREGSCFVEPVKDQVTTEESKAQLKQILATLQKKGWRMIPESDIGLAVAYSSTEKFCNPEFSVGAAVLGIEKIDSQTLTEREVYVPNTEEIMSAKSRNEQRSIRQKYDAVSSLNLTSYRADVGKNIRTCEALGCSNTNRNCKLAFFALPFNYPEKLKKWCENIQMKETTRKKDKSLCSVHFEVKACSSTLKKRLLAHAVPTIQAVGVKSEPKHACLDGYSSSVKHMPNEENMDVMEVPLSAQIKQELDDLFEVTVENKEVTSENNDLPSTQPIESCEVMDSNVKQENISTSQQVSSRLKRSSTLQNTSPHAQRNNLADEEPLNSLSNSSSRAKVKTGLEEKKPLENTVDVNMETELPRNCMKIKFVPLIRKKRESPVTEQHGNSSVKNFKKFKKVNFSFIETW